MNNYLNLEQEVIGPTYLVGILQTKVTRKLSNIMNSALKKHGITMTEWAILGLILKGLDIAEITKELEVKITLVSRSIRNLKQKKFITMKRVEEDRRKKILTLTDHAFPLVQQIEKELRMKFRGILGEVTYHDLMTYVKVLNYISNLKQD